MKTNNTKNWLINSIINSCALYKGENFLEDLYEIDNKILEDKKKYLEDLFKISLPYKIILIDIKKYLK